MCRFLHINNPKIPEGEKTKGGGFRGHWIGCLAQRAMDSPIRRVRPLLGYVPIR